MSNANNLSRVRKRQVAICFSVSLILVTISPFILRVYETRFYGQPIIPLTEFALCRLPYVILVLSACGLMSSFLTRERSWGDEVTTLFNCLIILGFGLYLIGAALPYFRYSIGL